MSIFSFNNKCVPATCKKGSSEEHLFSPVFSDSPPGDNMQHTGYSQ